MRLSLTRVVGFRAFHRLHRPEWSEAENRSRFGWTAEAPGHSHDFTCEVTVSGPVDERLAMVMDLPALDRILSDEVTGCYDGRHLNHDVPGLTDVLPTCEAIARDVFRRVERRLPAGVTLERVRVAEDATLHADCTRSP
jgi:6-pyruvoyltetrahydropterin/6-carboxytetrahydropterin synthase